MIWKDKNNFFAVNEEEGKKDYPANRLQRKRLTAKRKGTENNEGDFTWYYIHPLFSTKMPACNRRA